MSYRIIQTIEATCDQCGNFATALCDSVADGKHSLRQEGWIITQGVAAGRGTYTEHGEARCYCSRACRDLARRK